MKIVTRKEFMNLPAGTLFSYYKPCLFYDLNIKDSEPELRYPDFSMSSIIGAIYHNDSSQFADYCDEMEKGISHEMDYEFSGREGLFDDKLLYAIYEKEDVEKLIKRLQDTLIP